jgi:hypothetical protein
MERGITYICSGEKYMDEAIDSAQDVKMHGINTAVITSHDNKHKAMSGPFDEVIIKNMLGDIRDKVYNMHHSPWDNQTIFLDTDTRVLGDVRPLFNILERVDIAIARSPSKIVVLEDVPDTFPEFNTGVIAFNHTDSVQTFISEWKSRYEQQLQNGYPNGHFPVSPEADNMDDATPVGKKNDQPAFRKTLYLTDISYSTLPREYNFRGMGASVYNQVKIVHHRRWAGYDKLMNNLNSVERYRCYWSGKLHRQDGTDIHVKPIPTRIRHMIGRQLDILMANLPVGYISSRTGIRRICKKIYEYFNN